MSEPPLKITVATVTYNAAELIEKTIASVEKQDYPHVEHLIIDGNSQDKTLEAVHHYQERNSIAGVPHEVNCLSEPDHGLYDAMNKAIDMATGDYIVFLNAGDTFHENTTLSKIAAAAERYGETHPAVIYGHTDIVDGEGNFLRHRRLSPPQRLTWRSFASGMLVCHQAFYARTDLAKANPYNLKYRFSADFDWCIRIMREAKRKKLPLANAQIVVADYLNEGMTTKNHKASLRERFNIMTHHYGIFITLFQHLWFVVRNVVKK
ncbi:MAG: glycosyltransferase [Prevotellamassilia sp.]|nr:glycosyltransferase [Prevotellamassilia sp.]